MASSEEMVRPATASDREELRRLFEDTRRRLVETGTRNRLVHVNRANTRGNVLNILNGRPDEIHSALSTRRTMRFRALGTDDDGDGDELNLAGTGEPGVTSAVISIRSWRRD